jgi:hypothetical protein
MIRCSPKRFLLIIGEEGKSPNQDDLLAVVWCWSICGGTRPEGNVPSDWVVRTEEFFEG